MDYKLCYEKASAIYGSTENIPTAEDNKLIEVEELNKYALIYEQITAEKHIIKGSLDTIPSEDDVTITFNSESSSSSEKETPTENKTSNEEIPAES